MARRKKEPRSVHRENIALAAEKLFMKKGIEATSVNEIAAKAGYSKATIYVYFQNKEEIVGALVLESMQKLYNYIVSALDSAEDVKSGYFNLCYALLKYQNEFPFYFNLVLDYINIDFENSKCLNEEKETYLVGEKINKAIYKFFQKGISMGELRKNIDLLPVSFAIWGMISGLIQLASSKEAYIMQAFNVNKEEFLKKGFETLYYSVAKGNENE